MEYGTAWGQGGLCMVGVTLSLTGLAPSPQGVITVKGLVDREKGDFYTLTVVADDGGPKVDSTVVSGPPGESPTGTARHCPRAPQSHNFTSHPTHGPGTKWVRVSTAMAGHATPSWTAGVGRRPWAGGGVVALAGPGSVADC